MDKIKRLRTAQRALLKKGIQVVEAELIKEEISHQVLYERREQLQRIMTDIRELDASYREALLDGDATEKVIMEELEAVDECEMKFTSVCRKISQEVSPVQTRATSPAPSNCPTSRSETQKRTVRLPKIELSKFNGELKEWLGWWALFSKIHEDESLHLTDKFHYLIQSMEPGSEAREIVCSYPQTADNYPKAIEALKERFGRENLLLQVYIRELLQLVICNVDAKEKMPMEKLCVKLESHLRSLHSLNLATADPATWLFPLVESSLPEEVLRAWQRSPMSKRDGAREEPRRTSLDILMEFVKTEVRAEQQISLARAGFHEENAAKTSPKKGEVERVRNYQKGKNKEASTAASLHSGAANGCIFCRKDNHNSADCYAAHKMTLEQRGAKVKEARRCFNCLKLGHIGFKCKSPARCFVCGKKHHTLLCQGESASSTSPKVAGEPEVKEDEKKTVMTSAATNQRSGWMPEVVLMKTIRVKVAGTCGAQKEVRLLFDDGSQRSYIKETLAKELSCKKVGEMKIQNCVFGGQVTEVKNRSRYLASLKGVRGHHSQEVILIGEPVLTGNCPYVPRGKWIKELEKMNIVLSDVQAGTSDVDILIGSDLWGQFMTGQMVKLQDGLVAVESVFGWTLSGALTSGQYTFQDVSLTTEVLCMQCSEERKLSDLWNLDTIGIKDPVEIINKDEHDLQVKTRLQEGFTRDKEGRYVVRLPWIDKRLFPPANRDVAEKRLMSCTKRLKSEEEFHQYHQIFKEWELEGIIEEVPVGEISLAEHFLPHRPVFRDSQTTPVRPVFDASCRGKTGPSLNECLEKGPNLLELIPSILLRFREGQIGASADIRKAFQMIAVEGSDCNFQQFLWWRDEEKKQMIQYRHRRVVFGINCSPFILAAVLEWHLSQVGPEEEQMAATILRSLYVDNAVASFNTTRDYEMYRKSATRILKEAGMELRQWESNCLEAEKKVTSVLGMIWHKERDELCCHLPEKLNQTLEGLEVTKRTVLALVAQWFDPLGVLCPALIVQKKKLQDSWAKGIGWDTPWAEEEKKKFLEWCREARTLEQLKIPRCAFGGNQINRLELHCFVDASQYAYAAVVFARVVNTNEVTIQLLMAKSRLAPLGKSGKKVMTIPRLELLGCLVGSRLLQSVVGALDRNVDSVSLWSDSSTALAWIDRDSDWGTFVGNRVREIRRLSEGWTRRYVPGEKNPADLPSRGCGPSKLVETRWWEGPLWLREPEETWPDDCRVTREEDICMEMKKTSVHMAVETPEPRFSSFEKNVRVAAYTRRFIENLRRKQDKLQLQSSCTPTPDEMDRATQDVIAVIQRRHFRKIHKVPGLWVQRSKDDGLLHVKTRLDLKQEWDLFKFPILLPKQDPLVDQLIRKTHRQLQHAGAQVVLSSLREKFWILGGRRTINRTLRECVVCRRYSVKGLEAKPSPLPLSRIEMQAAFQTTGVDLAGPVLLKGGKKAWIVLYTCAVYRGVYLDWVPSLNVNDFLDSLEKFCCEVGRPSTLYSDNGTNFVATETLMKKLDWEKLKERSNVKRIRWRFNPPCAAWWGGWWERLIRTMKGLLRKMLGTAKLQPRDLTKSLAAVAYVMNSRPLTTVTEDPEDLRPLTPFMFMRDLPIGGLPEREAIRQKDLQEAYQKITTLKAALKARFRKEYLAQLVQRRNETKRVPLMVGDVVLVEVHNRKRCEWPMARVIELIPGKDGEVRVAKVRLRHTELFRPVQRLFPLEVSRGQRSGTPVVAAEEENEVTEPETQDVPDPAKEEGQTRSRRKVKRPNRYGDWVYNNVSFPIV